MTHRPRKQTPRLPCASERRYTSFKELGVASPQLEEFETDDTHNDGNSNSKNNGNERSAPNAAHAGKGEGQGQSDAGKNKKQQGTRKEVERVKVTGVEQEGGRRARSGSMRLVEWLMRTRSSSSAP